MCRVVFAQTRVWCRLTKVPHEAGKILLFPRSHLLFREHSGLSQWSTHRRTRTMTTHAIAPSTSRITAVRASATAKPSSRRATRVVAAACGTNHLTTLTNAALALALAFTPPAFAAPNPYGGVGLEIYIGPDRLPAIVEFLPTKKTGPAHDAGFMLNDKILEVDGAATTDLGGLKGVADALRGDAGTDVDVTVGRGRGRAPLTVEKVTIKREEITPNPRSCFVGSCARV